MEEEEEVAAAAGATATTTTSTPSSGQTSQCSTQPSTWAVGSRLESKARDSTGGEQWFPAKVLEVEADGRGVLVHYMQWNARHDEWIPIGSPRLRPPTGLVSAKGSRHNSGNEPPTESSSNSNSSASSIGASPSTGSTSFSTNPSLSLPPAVKDFKAGEKVMATWKLNRKYLASVIRYEPESGTYLVEFYDGVKCNVKPNNMRRPRKGEDDAHLDQVEVTNGGGGNGETIADESAENSEAEDSATPGGSTSKKSSGRRERKRRFDVKELLNMRPVKSLRRSKDDDSNITTPDVTVPQGGGRNSKVSAKDDRKKRRSDRVMNQKSEDSSSAAAVTTNGADVQSVTPDSPSLSNLLDGGDVVSVNKSKVKSLEGGPALAAVSGKRERRKKKFWDEEQPKESKTKSTSVSSSTASPGNPNSTSTSNVASSQNSTTNNKRKSSISGGSKGKSREKKSATTASSASNGQASDATISSKSDLADSSKDDCRPNGKCGEMENKASKSIGKLKDFAAAATAASTTVSSAASVTASPNNSNVQVSISGKENGKVLPYLQFDLNSDPQLIAEKMIEGVNIPGMGQPIPVDSSSLPHGWEKRVIQRRIGITKGKWDVFITNPETGKSFRSKTELQKHLDERKLPYTSDAFDFSLDDNLKRLRQIWKQYKVKPFLNQKGNVDLANCKHVPAKITQVTDEEILRGGSVRGPSGGSSAEKLARQQQQKLQQQNHQLSDPKASVGSVIHSSSQKHHHQHQGHAASRATSSSCSGSVSIPSSASAVAGNAAGHPEQQDGEAIDLSDVGVESETGQGLRCSICSKLFRNDRLLQQHIKHYHPKVYKTLARSVSPQESYGEEISFSEPTSPLSGYVDGRRISDNSNSEVSITDVFGASSADIDSSGGGHSRKRKISTAYHDHQHHGESSKRGRGGDFEDYGDADDKGGRRGSNRTNKRSLTSMSSFDEELPLSSYLEDDEGRGRTRADSVATAGSAVSDTEDLQDRASGHCPPTPPTFRLSKRRLAQMRRRIPLPVVRMSKIEDTSLAKDYRDELLSLSIGAPTTPPNTSHTPDGLGSGGSTSSAFAAMQPSSSYPPSEMDASVAGSEHLTSEELVNCTCKRVEEDGLMIQCDICLCWQHGYCVGIDDGDDEDPVPDKHVCEICRLPPGGRTEARFSLDQDWLKEGKLPSVQLPANESPFGDNYASTSAAATSSYLPPYHHHQKQQHLRPSTSLMANKETAFRKLSELMADLSNLSKTLHGLRVKLHVASQPNNNKVFMWSSVWKLPSQPFATDAEAAAGVDIMGLSERDAAFENRPNGGLESDDLHQNEVPCVPKKLPYDSKVFDPEAVAEKLKMVTEERLQQEAEAAEVEPEKMDTATLPSSTIMVEDEVDGSNDLLQSQDSKDDGALEKAADADAVKDSDGDEKTNDAPEAALPRESIEAPDAKSTASPSPDLPKKEDDDDAASSPSQTTEEDPIDSKNEESKQNGDEVDKTEEKSVTTKAAEIMSNNKPVDASLTNGTGNSPPPDSPKEEENIEASSKTPPTVQNQTETSSLPTPPSSVTETNCEEDEGKACPNEAEAEPEQSRTAADGGEDEEKPEAEAETEVASPAAKESNGESEQGSTPPDGNLLDPNFIPSMSEVERLLPSVLKEMGDATAPPAAASSTSDLSKAVVLSAPSTPAPVLIPEPKRLDRDECRLNLLQHIDTVQTEVMERFEAIEAALNKIERMPAIVWPAALESESQIKARMNMLMQDLDSCRQMLWAL